MRIFAGIVIIVLPLIFIITLYYLYKLGKKYEAIPELLQLIKSTIHILILLENICIGFGIWIMIGGNL